MRYGGRSCGKLRHVQPLRARYNTALTISRRSYLAGRPPCFGSGSQGAILRHWASVMSLG